MKIPNKSQQALKTLGDTIFLLCTNEKQKELVAEGLVTIYTLGYADGALSELEMSNGPS